MRLIRASQDALAEWVLTHSGGYFVPGIGTAIVLGDESGRPVAGVAFTDYNGRNVSCHIAIKDKRAALPLLTLAGRYVFEQLRCTRLTLVAESSNIAAVRLHQKLGAVREGVLVGAGRKGEDIYVSRLTPDAEIWQRLKRRFERKTAEVV